MTWMSPRDLSPEDLPEALDPERRRLLLDLYRLWMRQSDLRFGQLVRMVTNDASARPGTLEDGALTHELERALGDIPKRPLPDGPYWDTESRDSGSFMRGFPRDPARIPQLIKTLGRAWLGHPELSIGQLLELALDRAGVQENEFGTRWLLIEDRALERTLRALEVDPRPGLSPAARSTGRASGSTVTTRKAAEQPQPAPGPVPPVAVVHAGAAAFTEDLEKHADACRHWLLLAIENAKLLLELGHGALSAAKTAVQIMEDFPLFNAGHGSALCADGTVQMSAALMRGSDRQAGAVAGIRSVKHPIIAALAVLNSPEVMLIGAHADRYALERGAERRPNDYFITDRQRQRLREHTTAEEHGTVGAVCLDTHGVLAAATSTGGITGQPPGRVGDTPLIGAGTWADQRVAVSCSGAGEAFIQAGAAARVTTIVEGGAGLTEAADRVLADVSTLGGRGGLIAVDASGHTTTPYTTQTLLHAVWRSGSDPYVRIPGPAHH